MKPALFSLLALFFTFQASAQKAPTPAISLAKQTWKVDSISGLGPEGDVSEKLKRELGSLSITFLENGRSLIFLEDELVLMDYDVSKGSKGNYLNFSGVIMLYIQILEKKENSMVLGFQFPKLSDKELGKFHLSKATFSLADSLQKSMYGDYVLQEYMYSPSFDPYGNRIHLSYTTHMRLFEDGKMACNFGTLDSGTWTVDPKKLEIRLQGQNKLYHFSIESYMAKTIRVKTIAGTPDTTLTLYKSPFANFSAEDEYGDVVVEEDYDEMAVDTTAVEYDSEYYGTEDYAPQKTHGEMLCTSWEAYSSLEFGEVLTSAPGTFLIFYPDGTVHYSKGKKKTKGTWEAKESTQTIILNWGKKQEVAQYYWGYFYYDESYDTKNSLNLVFTPPGEKKVVGIEFRPLTTE